jgi:hypothetical protein
MRAEEIPALWHHPEHPGLLLLQVQDCLVANPCRRGPELLGLRSGGHRHRTEYLPRRSSRSLRFPCEAMAGVDAADETQHREPGRPCTTMDSAEGSGPDTSMLRHQNRVC